MSDDIELPELIAAVSAIVEPPPQTIEYRLYHDDSGIPLFMSSSDYPDGEFIVIDREIYDRADYQHLRVKDGKLVKIEDDFTHHNELIKGVEGYRTVKNHASLILRTGETYQGETETYGFKNH